MNPLGIIHTRCPKLISKQLADLDTELEALLDTIPGAKEMKAIPGLGAVTVVLFYSEVGDITNYSHPQQLVNLAGL
ncbi:transposase [Desulfitispora alkaliphila]